MKFYPGTLHSKLCKLLFRYRITPLNNGKTPSELLFGRNLRSELDLIKPTSRSKNNAVQPDFNKGYKLGERVQSRNYTSSNKWKYGTVVEKLGRLHYLIELDDGYVIKRHFNQLRPCQVTRDSLDFSPSKRVHFSLPEIPSTSTSQNDLALQHYDQSVPLAGPDTTPLSPGGSSVPPGNSVQKTSKSSMAETVPLRKSTRERKPAIRLSLKK